MSYKDYNINLTFKAILLFERMVNHSFMRMSEEEMIKFIYCIFITSNSLNITFDGFMFMWEDAKFAQWLTNKVDDLMGYIKQFKSDFQDKEETKEDSEPVKLTKAITYLAANGIDYQYLVNEMQLWELDGLLEAVQDRKKEELELDRLWTYVGISPLIDSKKVKNPQALIKFPWEKEAKNKKAMDDLKAKQDAIKAFFIAQEERNKQKEQEKDAKDK